MVFLICVLATFATEKYKEAKKNSRMRYSLHSNVSRLTRSSIWACLLLCLVHISKAQIVIPAPDSITGPRLICGYQGHYWYGGYGYNYSYPVAGGTWSSSNAAVATINGTGHLFIVSTGSTTISYTVPVAGGTAISSKVITIADYPPGYGPMHWDGNINICTGSAVTLSAFAPGGTWRIDYRSRLDSAGFWQSDPDSSSIQVSSSGVVTSADSNVRGQVIYSISTVCGTSYQQAVVTVEAHNIQLGSILGDSVFCYAVDGAIIHVHTNAASMNHELTWVSSDTSVIRLNRPVYWWGYYDPSVIDTVRYISTGHEGVATVSVSTSNACGTKTTMKQFTATHIPDTIVAPNAVCVGQTVTLANATPGGKWSTWGGDPTYFTTIDSVTGEMHALHRAWSASYFYTLPNGCGTSKDIQIADQVDDFSIYDKLVPGIGGYDENSNIYIVEDTVRICQGTYALLPVSPGTIISTSDTICSIGGGWAYGQRAGIAILTFTSAVNCDTTVITKVLVVEPTPLITVPEQVCMGPSTTLFTSIEGGMWYPLDGSGFWSDRGWDYQENSNRGRVIAESSSNYIQGLSEGPSVIVYRSPAGCYSEIKEFSVLPPPAFPGASSLRICEGATVELPADDRFVLHYHIDDSSIARCSHSSSDVNTFLNGYLGLNVSSHLIGLHPGVTTMTVTKENICGVAVTVDTIYVEDVPDLSVANNNNMHVGDTLHFSGIIGATWRAPSDTYFINSLALSDSSATRVTFVAARTGGGYVQYLSPMGCSAVSGINVVSDPAVEYSHLDMCEGERADYWYWYVYGGRSIVPGSHYDTSVISFTDSIVVARHAGTTTLMFQGPTGGLVLDITVRRAPAPITGPGSICIGDIISLHSTTPGGQWTSWGREVSATNSASAQFQGLFNGMASVWYILPNGCNVVKNIYVHDSVGVHMTPPLSVCIGGTDHPTFWGGTWRSSDTTIAKVDENGFVTGRHVGTVTITATDTSSCGVVISQTTVTVRALPAPIVAPAVLCGGTSVTATTAATGGVWSSDQDGVYPFPYFAVDHVTGKVTAYHAGNGTLFYTDIYGCSTEKSLTIEDAVWAGSTSDTIERCTGQMDILPGSISMWHSSATGVATLHGDTIKMVGPGNATVTYHTVNVCGAVNVVRNFRVFPSPAPIAHSGGCMGEPLILSDATPNGVWMWSNGFYGEQFTSDAAELSLPTPTSGGYTNFYQVYYITSHGCSASHDFTVYPETTNTPTISLPGTICKDADVNILINNAVGEHVGVRSSNPSVVSIDMDNWTIHGANVGTAVITYTDTTELCGVLTATTTVTVSNTAPAQPVISAYAICEGTTVTASDVTPGGTWSSSGSSITINADGVISGINSGRGYVMYTLANGCSSVSAHVDVHSPTGDIYSDTAALCLGQTKILVTTPQSGGVWSAGSGVAIVDTSTPGYAIVSGLSAGATIVTYSYTNTCGNIVSLDTVHFNGAPDVAIISGASTLSLGETGLYSDLTPRGLWYSADTSVLWVIQDGHGTGLHAGHSDLYYIVGRTCGINYDHMPVTVGADTVSLSISGPADVCTGLSITLTANISSGTWSSSNTAVATVSNTGVVHGVSGGSVTISYTVGGNIATYAIMVDPPAIISVTGADSACVNGYVELTANGEPGGLWSTDDMSGHVYFASPLGGFPGLINWNYPTTISAPVTFRAFYTITSGVCAGTFAYKDVTIVPYPNAGTVTGADGVCWGSTNLMSDVVEGGTWSSSNSSIFTVDNSGLVTGVSAGSATVSYTVANSCGAVVATKTLSVVLASSLLPITGIGAVCQGGTTSLSNAIEGGTWSSNTPGIATVSSTGIVYGVSAGTATISYVVLYPYCASSAYATKVVTVNPLPVAGTITGSGAVCGGNNVTLSNTATGGIWSSSNASVAAVSGGVVSGVSNGTATISYSVTNGCGTAMATQSITVNPLPVAGTIGGGNVMCQGTTAQLFSKGLMSFSPAGSLAGTIEHMPGNNGPAVSSSWAGVSVNMDNIAMRLAPPSDSDGCVAFPSGYFAGKVAVVWRGGCELGYKALQAQNAGAVACIIINNVSGAPFLMGAGSYGGSVTIPVYNISINDGVNVRDMLSSGTNVYMNYKTVDSGTWSTSDVSLATVNSIGTVSGVGAGNVTVTYTATGSCGNAIATYGLSILPTSLPSIDGANSLCAGTVTTYTETVAGGVWSSSPASIGTIDVSGNYTALSVGSSYITYSLANSCGTYSNVKTINVNSGQALIISNLAGTTSGYSGDGGAAVAAKLQVPYGVVADKNGNVYIADFSNNRIRKVSRNGTISTLYGTGVAGYSGDHGLATSARFNGPACIAIDDTGSLYVADYFNSRVRKIDTFGIITTVAGNGVTGYSGDGGPATAASFNNPIFVFINPSGELIITDDNNSRVRKVSASGYISTIAGTGVAGYNGDEMLATAAKLNNPGAAIQDSAGNVYISDVDNNRIRKITPDGYIHTYAGTGVAGWSGDGGAPNSAQISGPYGLSEYKGDLYFSEVYGNRIRLIRSGVMSTIAGNGTVGYSGDNGYAQLCQLNIATGLYATESGVYVADAYNNKVRLLTTKSGLITGANKLCIGASISLTSNVTGGVWSTSAPSVVTINSSGTVTALTSGNATITYSLATPCGNANSIHTITVLSPVVSSIIADSQTVCAGASISIVPPISGGAFSSVNAAIASVDILGQVTGHIAGFTLIQYTKSVSACAVSVRNYNIKVSDVPSLGDVAFSFDSSMCIYETQALHSSGLSGGMWSSSNAAVASIGSTGVVSGISAGTANISYTLTNSCGARTSTKMVTVNPMPNAGTITGPDGVCVTSVALMSNTVTGGSWSSSNTSILTVNSSGLVTGVAAGSATISYTVANSCGTAGTLKTLSAVLASSIVGITGSGVVCSGGTTTLSHVTPGGTWSSNAPGIATVSSTGIVYGLSAGTATISYIVTFPYCGATTAYATRLVTVNPLPSVGSITGTANVCPGSSTGLYAATGGTWTSSNTTIATIGSTGIVFGVSAGTTTISYAVTNSCGTAAATRIVTVDPLPNAGTISGPSTVCASSNITLSTSGTGGVWSSNSLLAATVDSAGVVTGVAYGSPTILYSVTNSCGGATAYRTITVNPLPSVGAITGTATVCAGGTTTLSDISTGGTWMSGNTAVATVSSTGIVRGVSGGNASISYTVTNSCGSGTSTRVVTVNPLPNAGAITGPDGVCVTSVALMSNTATGGSWSSSNTSILTVNSSGLVTGVSAGSATISYTVTNSCGTAVATKTLSSVLATSIVGITGIGSVCPGGTTTLSHVTPGGAWSSNAPGIATVSSTGVVYGVSAGTATISYIVTYPYCGATTAYATRLVTVNPLPSVGSITGTANVCPGSSTGLYAATGGTWTSSNTTIATIGSTGIVFGVSAGTTTISYAVTNSCGTAAATRIVTVDPLPNAGTISGPSTVCASSNITLSTSGTGGVWSSNSLLAATVDSAGVVTGVAYGSPTILYSVTNSCGGATAYRTITVNPLPSVGAITGTATVCAGGTTTLSDISTGGTWMSGNTAVATVSSTGIVRGVSGGNASISYTVTNSCGSGTSTRVVTVNPLPNAGAITGPDGVCVTSVALMSNTATGGSWSSSNTSILTVNSSGLVTGVSAGSATISYTVTNSCGTAVATKTLSSVLATSIVGITGIGSVCPGGTTTLSHVTPGGAWSSNAPGIATVSSTGVVYGVSAGTATISYIVTYPYCGATTAYATRLVTVNPLPLAGAITGTATVCAAATTTLSDATTGGTWTSSNTTIATVGSTGIVRGVSGGNATISYTVTNSCGTAAATKGVTVNSLPAAGTISGASALCISSSTSLISSVSGGSWSSSNAGIATISSSGIISGVNTGNVVITYSVTNSCGTSIVTKSIVINALPAAIAGTNVLCAGSSVTMTDVTAAGTWSISGVGVATINAATHVVTGLSSGNAIVSYTLATGCYATRAVTVNITPSALASIPLLCIGQSVSLTNSLPGGVWSSSSVTSATVTPTGVVTALSAYSNGTIRYTVGSCYASTSFTVNTTPANIAGVGQICQGGTVTLTNSVSGGTWSTANSSIATVVSGHVTGVTVGTTTITYATGSCYKTRTVVINTSPAPLPAALTLCVGDVVALSDTVGGGAWSSSGPTLVTVTPDGVVTALASFVSTRTISYGVGTCVASTLVSVGITPASISGASSVCTGSLITLTNSVSGGTWTSGTTSAASVSSTGIVSGLSSGNTTITYAIGGCYKTKDIAVNIGPAPMGPVGNICVGQPVSLSNAVSGGTWSVSDTAVITVTSGGVLTAIDNFSTPRSVIYTIGSCSVSAPVTVNMTPKVIVSAASVCSGSALTMSNTITGGIWSTASSSIATILSSTAGSAVVSGVAAGTTTVTYSIGSCYKTKSITITNCGAKGADEEGPSASGSVTEVRIYPNPATSMVIIDAPVVVHVQVYSADGRLVMSEQGVRELDVNRLSAGMYMIAVYDEQNNLLKRERLVKE